MAFLDNSGDIILDAVLTDAGRARMAQGNFRITKFAFSDEEINYRLFDGTATTGNEDKEIMETPILEAFTNNTSLMKTKLISINRENILYLPTFKLNTSLEDSKQHAIGGTYVLIADTATEPTSSVGTIADGVLHGVFGSALDTNGHYIALDQGMDPGGAPPRTRPMDSDLIETAFLIRMDHRLINLQGFNGAGYTAQAVSFIDDDSISAYLVAANEGSVVGTQNRLRRLQQDTTRAVAEQEEVFNGPIGPRLRFSLSTSPSLQFSTALFDELGSAGTTTLQLNSDANDNLTSGNYKFIDTIVNVVGISSGFSIDIPIRIVKKTS